MTEQLEPTASAVNRRDERQKPQAQKHLRDTAQSQKSQTQGTAQARTQQHGQQQWQTFQLTYWKIDRWLNMAHRLLYSLTGDEARFTGWGKCGMSFCEMLVSHWGLSPKFMFRGLSPSWAAGRDLFREKFQKKKCKFRMEYLEWHSNKILGFKKFRTFGSIWSFGGCGFRICFWLFWTIRQVLDNVSKAHSVTYALLAQTHTMHF